MILDDHARTALAAAEQLGVTVAQIANSLVFALPAGAAAGHPRSVFRTTYEQLLRLTGGLPVEVV